MRSDSVSTSSLQKLYDENWGSELILGSRKDEHVNLEGGPGTLLLES